MKKLIRRTIIATAIVYVFVFVTCARGLAMLIGIYPWIVDVLFWAFIIAIVTRLVIYIYSWTSRNDQV